MGEAEGLFKKTGDIKGQRGGPDRMNVIFPEPSCCHVKAGRNFG